MKRDMRFMIMRYLCTLLLSLFLFASAIGQTRPPQESSISTDTSFAKTETVLKQKKGSIFAGRPGKAALYSLILPGTGQIYNKSYLRVPFVYGAVGFMGYILLDNTQSYQCFRDAYIARIDGDDLNLTDRCRSKGGSVIINGDASTLRLIRDQFDKNRQSAILGFAAVWLANSIDAFVNAHLKEFDVDDDLSSIRIKPMYEQNMFGGPQMGIVISF